MKRLLTSTILLCLTAAMATVHAVSVTANVDVAGELFPDRQRVEPSIAIDPQNPSILVAAAQDLRLFEFGDHRWLGYYRSIDGGQTWSSTLLPGFPGDSSPQGLSSPLHGFRALSDSVVAFDRLGNVYLTGITTRLSLFVAKYVHDGADYSFTTLICPRVCADKPWIAVDTSGGSNDGNVYVVYDGVDGVDFVRSTDGAQTFSVPMPALKGDSLSGVAVDPHGLIYVSGIRSSRSTTALLEVAVSMDGGQSFTGHEKATNIVPIPFLGNTTTAGPFPGNSFRVATIPQIAADFAGVYIVWDDYSLNNSNVLFVKSTDNGITWNSPIRLNDVQTGQHFFSTIAVSAGLISVAWYDSRLGQQSNGTITGLDVFYASSNNGGASFSSNLRLTSNSFNPNLVDRSDFGDTEKFIGDYIQIAASTTFAQAIWTDNRNACDTIDTTFGCVDQDIFTSSIIY